MRILSCIVHEHTLWMLALVVPVCLVGSAVALQLYRRARQREGLQRTGWVFLAAVAAGSSVWCTHFVAMLAYQPDLATSFDPVVTLLSLMIAMGGGALAFTMALVGQNRAGHPDGWLSTLAGGLLLGGSVAAMHYLGMAAMEIRGTLDWSSSYVVASVAVALAGGAFCLAAEARGRPWLAFAAFAATILGLHFTGMAALTVVPLDLPLGNAVSHGGLAAAVVLGVFIIVAVGAASYMIDTDVTEQAMGALRRMALSDSLTGLPNRQSFTDRLELKVLRHLDDGRGFAVVMIDLDRFKAVNDVHGHEGGDRMLAAVAERMRAVLQPDEFLARIGGDEFAAIVPHKGVQEGAHAVDGFIGRLETTLALPIRIREYDVLPHASFGVSIFPLDGDSAAQILGNADLAMYRAKADMRRGVCYYEAEMDEAARLRRELILELRRAAEREEFELHYQLQAELPTRSAPVALPPPGEAPAVAAEALLGAGTSTIVGYEALLRWRHPVRGYVSPAEFIPLAEETGLILPIGAWVLRAACREAAAWRGSYRVAVNLSAVQIAHCDLPALVAEVLAESGLPATRLELEITETSIIEDKARCLAALEAVRALGVTIALDDFGTGYSSLDTLRSFPFHRIKLDRTFMRDIATSAESRAILRAVLTLGRSLDIRVLAEGVETIEQLALLAEEGCSEVQGFLFGRPERQVEAACGCAAA
ncbi:EAL domain-containing protein [Ancylobacter sp. 6x-1]|uniref:EAL domain-containing protein n=1 Tax=Ancylobacter crimeensis TaxID=2579147 RepID=A0ABT0DD44_9HYPH|nr:EAL domain-containing protein [Ancylobacter crimeensis]MCK0197891.1 EAL domain-containing protein [Ancylobacter crimeensis]